MTFVEHLKSRKDIYLLILSWPIVGAFLPKPVAIGYAVLTFLLVLRTRDLTRIFIAFITMLIFSDSRSAIFGFAETAKIGAVVLLFLFVWLNFNEFKQGGNRLFVFFLPFLFWSVLASVWASVPFTAFQKSLSYGLIFFLVPIVFQKASETSDHFQRELVYVFAMILAAGLLIHLINPAFTTLVGRYRGLLGNPNGLGIFLTVVFAVYYPIQRRFNIGAEQPRFHYLFIGVFLISLILTGSRTALIAILLFYFFNRLRYLSNFFTILVFLTLVASYEYLLLQLPAVIQFLGLEEYFRIDTLEEGSGRFVAWNFAWQRVQDVFFVGGGFGHTEYVFQVFRDELSRLGHQGNAHNSYLTIWLDTGLIGIVLFAVGLMRSIAASIKRSPFTLPIVYAVLFTTYFESWLAGSLNPITSIFLISLVILTSEGISKETITENKTE